MAAAKWEGKTTAGLVGPTAGEVWPLVSDFCSIHKWLPFVEKCEHVGGPHGELGEIRRCSSAAAPFSAGEGGGEAQWAEEKLVALDPVGRRFSYEIVGSNIGFRSYAATWKVLETNGGDEKKGCAIEWSFACDPIEGWKFEDFMGHIETSAKAMAKKLEDALLKSSV